METLMTVASVVIGILIVAIVFKYLEKKHIISRDNMGIAINVINIAKNIISDLGLKENIEKTATEVLDIADAVADYVYYLSQVTTIEDKEKLANDVVNEILETLGITPSDNDKNLIKIIIEESLKFWENVKK